MSAPSPPPAAGSAEPAAGSAPTKLEENAGASPGRFGRWIVPALALLAIAPRAGLAFRLDSVCRDAYFYQMLSAKLRDGDVTGGLDKMGLNLYIGLLALLGNLGELIGVGPIAMGMAWGVLAGGLTVFPLYDWLKNQFGRGVAIAGCGAFAVHPTFIEFGVEPIRDGTFWLLAAGALACGYRATRPRSDADDAASPTEPVPPADTAPPRLRWFVLAGLATTAAFLTRTEGWLLFVPILLWTALALWRRPTRRRRLLGGAAAALAVGPAAILMVNLTLLHDHPRWEWGRLSVLQTVGEWVWTAVADPAATPIAPLNLTGGRTGGRNRLSSPTPARRTSMRKRGTTTNRRPSA